MLELFGVEVSIDLNLHRRGQTLDEVVGQAVQGIGGALGSLRPDLVIVQGDTSTAFAGAVAALHRRLPVGHVEAGLRTSTLLSPWPEEGNRRAITHLSTLHFAPTEGAARALRAESVPSGSIFLTGNTVVDGLLWCLHNGKPAAEILSLTARRRGGRLVLVTLHRRESWGEPIRMAIRAVRRLALAFPHDAFVFPVHANPLIGASAQDGLADLPNVDLIAPAAYADFVHLMSRSSLILSDSGGVQEEAPTLRVPVLVLRDVTERPEALGAGARLVGTDEDAIFSAAAEILDGDERLTGFNPFGDGHASARIEQAIASHFGRDERPADFDARAAAPADGCAVSPKPAPRMAS